MQWALDDKINWNKIAEVPSYLEHFQAVKRIKFNIRCSTKASGEEHGDDEEIKHTFATCSSD